MQPSGALIWSGKGSLAMSYELKMKLLMHLVCIAQWGVFALIHWEMLGKGKWKHPFACTALAMCGMLVISLWIDFGFFNAASIAFNVLYLLVTSAFFGGTIRQKLMSCMANGVVCLLTENTVIYLYTYLEAVPPAQVIFNISLSLTNISLTKRFKVAFNSSFFSSKCSSKSATIL